MSAPKTHQELSANPSAGAVTAPASGAALEADVQRKMKLWGVIEAFRSGRMPDNAQIDAALAYAQEHAPVEVGKLSSDGALLVDDVRDILETLRAIVQEKNADELFQTALWSSYTADPKYKQQLTKDGVVPVTEAEAKKDADEAAKHLRVLLTLFVTNSEVRKLAKDFGLVARDIFSTGAARAADKVRPSQAQLDQIDTEAPAKQWVGPDGKILGPNESPELQVKAADGAQVRYDPKQAPGEAKVMDADGNTRTAGSIYTEAQERKAQALETRDAAVGAAAGAAAGEAQNLNASRDRSAPASVQKQQVQDEAAQRASQGARAAQGVAQDVNRNVDSNDMQQARAQAEDKARNVAQSTLDKIPEKHRVALTDGAREGKQIVLDALPEERRRQFVYRLKKVVVELQEHKDYREAMGWLLDTLDTYGGYAEHMAGEGVAAGETVASDPKVQTATRDWRMLLERFANGQSLSGVFGAVDKLYADAKRDPELRAWWSAANDYAHRILLEPGFILDEDADREGSQLVESGKKFFTQRYKADQQRFADEVQSWCLAFADDPLNQRLGDDVKRLTKDLLFNQDGNLEFKPHLWNDLRVHFLPAIIENIGYIPIPRAEYEDNGIALVIENLILSGPNLFPNVVTMESYNRFTFSPYPKINKGLDTHHHKLHLGMSQIQADIRDVAFSFKRKTGWPKLSDHGLADVVISGKGISIDATIESVENDRNSVFKVDSVNVDIDHMTWKIRDSKHDLLYKFLKSTATGVIKKAIQTAVKSALRNALEEVDSQITQIRNTAEDAKNADSDEVSRRQAIKDLYDRKRREAQQASKEAKDSTGTFRIVTNRDAQLNPDMTHDKTKSIAQRIFKTEDLAHSGKTWHSAAFAIAGDKKHPAVSGEHHPSAKPGAAAGKGLTDQIPAQGVQGNQAPAHA